MNSLIVIPAIGLPTTDPPPRTKGGGTHAKLPPGSRTPEGKLGGGSTCKETPQPLTAFVPTDAKGLSTRTNPTLWFYVPYAPTDLESAQFLLVNLDGKKTLYQTPVQFSNTPGVVSIALPPGTIAPDQSVRWYLRVNCKGNTKPKPDLQLNGWITRVPATTPNPWYDQLDQLAQRRLAQPLDPKLQADWQALLKTVKLEPLAGAPLGQPRK